uniref:Uncharacterized protein n=1 Tax=Craspedostauros australis TaxID=1486917 RepID=A0A7S0F6W8_9STRA|mmetsp:Transcript_9634/g.26218  ORF Transcript_9634/g.26218 Transcript_9634/m.26218 type:complete len:379 (+) Transcript_9634:346-1482(+)
MERRRNVTSGHQLINRNAAILIAPARDHHHQHQRSSNTCRATSERSTMVSNVAAEVVDPTVVPTSTKTSGTDRTTDPKASSQGNQTPHKDITPELGAVQETLLIPLIGRVVETRKGKDKGMIDDPKSVEIIERLNYDFTKWESNPTIAGTVMRTLMMDEFVQSFLDDHPTGTVIEIGSGLNTRFERLDNGQVQWFDLDLPDTMALRRNFFDDEPRRTTIAASIVDTDWIETVQQTGGPYCFVSEAVIIYLEKELVQKTIRQIVDNFPDPTTTIVMDTTGTKNVDGQANSDLMKHLSEEAWFRWKCDDPAELEQWTDGKLKLMESRSFFDAPKEIAAKLAFPIGFLLTWVPFLMRMVSPGYRLNVYKVSGDTCEAGGNE